MESMDRYAARTSLVGLLAVQAILGYEWLMSGLTKVWRGGFPSGLGDELREKSEGAAPWYASLLDSVVIPNGGLFGVLIIVGELAIGLTMIATAALWAFRWTRLSFRGRTGLLAASVVAGVAGILMNINFHLANGSAHPWLVPSDGFDEGVDLDSFMPAVQLVLVLVAAGLWRAMSQQISSTDIVLRRVARTSQDVTAAGK